MCIFCAAIPMTVSLGAVAKSKQNEQRKRAETQDQPARTSAVPVEKVTAAVVGGLIVGAVVYHTTIAPRIGIW